MERILETKCNHCEKVGGVKISLLITEKTNLTNGAPEGWRYRKIEWSRYGSPNEFYLCSDCIEIYTEIEEENFREFCLSKA